jgi:hypothetical protein
VFQLILNQKNVTKYYLSLLLEAAVTGEVLLRAFGDTDLATHCRHSQLESCCIWL